MSLCIHLSVSSILRGNCLPCDLSFLKHLEKAVDFSVCSAFSLFLGQSDDFQTPYMLEPKPKVRHGFLNKFLELIVLLFFIQMDIDKNMHYVFSFILISPSRSLNIY